MYDIDMETTLYYVYIVMCVDKTLYTGITNNIEKRIHAHNTSKVGAKYTQGRRPVVCVYVESCVSKSEALKRELAIKRMSKDQKLILISTYTR